MGLYDGIKDVAKVMQQADNIELYQKLLEENAELKKSKDIESKIVRHKRPFLTLDEDRLNLKYCATCWDNQRKLIQMKPIDSISYPELWCNVCKSKCKNEG